MASSTMKNSQARIPRRQRIKQPSSETASIKVNTNMFKIKFDNDFLKKAVHYDVDITIKQPNKSSTQTTSNKFSKALCRKIFEQCRSKNFSERYPAFDGKKNAYSAYDLPFESPKIVSSRQHMYIFFLIIMKFIYNKISDVIQSIFNYRISANYETNFALFLLSIVFFLLFCIV